MKQNYNAQLFRALETVKFMKIEKLENTFSPFIDEFRCDGFESGRFVT